MSALNQTNHIAVAIHTKPTAIALPRCYRHHNIAPPLVRVHLCLEYVNHVYWSTHSKPSIIHYRTHAHKHTFTHAHLDIYGVIHRHPYIINSQPPPQRVQHTWHTYFLLRSGRDHDHDLHTFRSQAHNNACFRLWHGASVEAQRMCAFGVSCVQFDAYTWLATFVDKMRGQSRFSRSNRTQDLCTRNRRHNAHVRECTSVCTCVRVCGNMHTCNRSLI